MPRLSSGNAWVVIDNSQGEYALWPRTGTVNIYHNLAEAKVNVSALKEVRNRAKSLGVASPKGEAKVARADEWAAELTARAILGEVKEE